MNHLAKYDYVVFVIDFLVVSSYGYWVYRHKRKVKKVDTKGYFLAEGSLNWWAIGASIIACNISAEHFIGMSGSSFSIGLAIAGYERMDAATLIIMPVVFAIFLPGFFWKRPTSLVALMAALLTIPLSVLFKFLPQLTYRAIEAIPFLNRMSWVFCIIIGLMSIITLTYPQSKNNPQALEIDRKIFRVTPAFTGASVAICGMLTVLYTILKLKV